MKKIVFILFIIVFGLLADSKIKLWEDYNITSPQQGVNQSIDKKEDKDINRTRIHFNSDYDVALKDAKESKKYIFLIVTEQYCPWCEKLINRVLQDRELSERLIQDYIPVVVDKNNDYYPSNVGVTGTPSVFIINPNTGKIVKTLVGYHDKDYYIKWFDYISNLDNEL